MQDYKNELIVEKSINNIFEKKELHKTKNETDFPDIHELPLEEIWEINAHKMSDSYYEKMFLKILEKFED